MYMLNVLKVKKQENQVINQLAGMNGLGVSVKNPEQTAAVAVIVRLNW